MKVSVLIPTFNRHAVLLNNLNSLNYQTKKWFDVTVFDNGSTPPVVIDKATEFYFPLKLCRFDSNVNVSDLINKWIGSVESDIILVLADDDFLMPRAIETVVSYFRACSEIESITTGFSHFSHKQGKALLERSFSNQIYKYDAHHVGSSYLDYWCIGEVLKPTIPRMSHPSAAFFTKKLVQRTIESQKNFARTLLFDVGFLGACFNQQFIYYLDSNLVYIGVEPNTSSISSVNSPRLCWDRLRPLLKHVPLKSASHFNVAVESHLEIALVYEERFNLNCKIQGRYYVNQFREIANDSLWNEQTKIDFIEVLPFLDRLDKGAEKLVDSCLKELIIKARVSVG